MRSRVSLRHFFLFNLNFAICILQFAILCSPAQELTITEVEGQPLAANINRVIESLEFLGHPLPAELVESLKEAGRSRDASQLQKLLDPNVLLLVSINPESRVKVARGPADAVLQQAGYTPVLVKIVNDSTITKRLRITSPQAGPVYGGVTELSMKRQQQEHLRAIDNASGADRFLDLELFTSPPMTERLSGLEAEYAIALIYSSEAGKREATIGFDVEQGNQDLGFRGETPLLFEIRPAIPLKLEIRDHDGRPTTARLLFRDAAGHIYPPQPKRLAPDFFFQPHIYRADGEIVALPPGRFTVLSCRGPEYRTIAQEIQISEETTEPLSIRLERWIDPNAFGFFSGDHHIHAAGCAHYNQPTEGVMPEDMFRQVNGEGMNVGCVLTWGPCFSFQRQFFSADADKLSTDKVILKYDLEISGFGSQALGHVCLLDLKDQTYPGSEGTETKGWPTWTTPVMRWAKEQGGVTGYAHSASGIHIDPVAASQRLLQKADANGDAQLSAAEAQNQNLLLPAAFRAIDETNDGLLSEKELTSAHERAAEQLPNLAIPEMNGVGAMEISVTTAEGVCDFISAMDTARIQEWNTWYHILNCGFPLKVSGETDFPCMSGTRVGQGRVYVHLGDVPSVNFSDWCQGIAKGRSYVSDGFAHAVKFEVEGVSPGYFGDLHIDTVTTLNVAATVGFSPETPEAVAQGLIVPPEGRRMLGDTVLLHGPRNDRLISGGERLVELIVNGQPVASQIVPADGQLHDLSWDVPIEKSSWIALRQFPQLHTNPVNVIVADKPIRASRDSAQWCIETIELLWKNREKNISEAERPEAKATFDRALAKFRQIAAESQ